MKGGFFKEARPDKDARPKVGAGKKQWLDAEVELTATVFAEILDENSRIGRNDLERRVRSGTGVRAFRGRCAGDISEEPESQRDTASRMIREHTKHSSLCEMVQPVTEQAAEIFGRVKSKGLKDGMSMDRESEVKVLRDIIKECLIRHALKLINSDNSGTYASGSHDAGLLATPQGYYAGDLNSLDADCVKGLMEKGYGIQDVFLDDDTVINCYRELELMDFDGKLVEVQQQKMVGYRKDRICWHTLEQLDREKQPGLQALFKKLISIPFELNKKCSLYLQAGGNFQLGVYPKDSYYKVHVDGGYEDLNNGRKITALFYPNSSWCSGHGGELKLYKRRPNPWQLKKDGLTEAPGKDTDETEEIIEPIGGRLVLFRSRDIPHEVLMANKKRYAVTLWSMGPPGPGDQPDDHHTPT